MWEGVRGVGPFALSLSKGRSRLTAVRGAPITGVLGAGPFALREIEGRTGAR